MGILLLGLLIAMLAISSVSAAGSADPFIKANRSVHKFNSIVDSVFLKPLTKAYDRFTPKLAKQRVSNILSNIDDVVVTFNDLLRLDLGQAVSDLTRAEHTSRERWRIG